MKPDHNKTRVIVADGLTVRFPRTTAVDGVSLSIKTGSVYALLGRNGSGKSTIVRCLMGQLKPQSGRSSAFGLDSWHKRRHIMERTGLVPETPDVPQEMTAEAVARFAMNVHSTLDADEYRTRLRRFGVPTDRPFKTLSKGQQKQVSLALALATGPDLLVLDDPTLGLDAVARKDLVEELIGELADRGTTVLITTHDMAAIDGVADNVGIIQRGRMVLDESLDDLRARFRRLHFARATAAHDSLQAVCTTAGGLEPKAAGDAITTVLTRFDDAAAAALQNLPVQTETMDLEDIFISVCEAEEGASS